MSLKPTNIPLTAKEHDRVKCGVCTGCGCACGYIAYLKGSELTDLYGHPHDPNGMGSFCTKGLALIQEATRNPLRVRQALLKEGETFTEINAEGVLDWIKKRKGKPFVFLDRHTDLRDLSSAYRLTDKVYSDSLYLPFRATTLRPQEWREQRVILALECEIVFSEVMATRWLVDAFEKSAYIVAVSSRYGTTSAKASRRLLLKPPLVVKFLEDIALSLEGERVDSPYGEEVQKLARAFSIIESSLILIGETLLRSPWRESILSSLQRIRQRTRVNYSIVGNISPFPTKELADFLEDFKKAEWLLLTGNPAMYMGDGEIEILKQKPVLSLSLFPNLTANSSQLVVPAKLFPEREFFPFRNGFGFVAHSPAVLTPPPSSFSLHELLDSTLGVGWDEESLLRKLGLKAEDVMETEGGADIDMPYIEELESYSKEAPQEEGVFLVCDNTLVDELGHWNPWTHDIEREQFAYMNERTRKRLGAEEVIEIRGAKLKVKLNSNIADDVVFVPSSYEESQPFDPGVRIGRLMKNPHLRIERFL